MREEITPSWLLNTKLNDHTNLFVDDTVASNYFARVYSCKCGSEEIVTGDFYNNEYSCPHCRNSSFIDVEEIKKDPESFILEYYHHKFIKLNFKFHTKVAIHNNKVEALALIKIPSSINFLEKEILKEDLIIASAPYTPKIKPIENIPLRAIEKELQKLTTQKQLFAPFIDRKLSSIYSRKEKQFEFILNHYNLKDLEFIKWSDTHFLTKIHYTIETALLELANMKQSKSIKHAIFENYLYQIKTYKSFNPLFIYAITSKFSDVNHIATLIDLKENFPVIEDGFLFGAFLEYLLSRYTQKQVTHYFIKLQSLNHHYLLRDTLLTFRRLGKSLYDETKKVKCTPNIIHDNLVQISLKIKYKNRQINHFEYSELQLSHLVNIGRYNVNLPKNNLELYEWADELQNCLAGYEELIASHRTTVYGFFIQSKLIFAAEINKGAIVQAYQKYNISLEAEQRKILRLWLKESKERVFIAKQSQNLH